MQSHPSTRLVALFGLLLPFLALFLLFDLAQGCGLPPPPAAPSCCCGGCGGRKKREAVQQHYKGEEVPCPQTEWKQIMEGALSANDDQSGSISAIQNALFRRFPTEKFLVICALAKSSSISPTAESQNAISTKIEAAKQLPQAIHFSSAGDGYCNVLANGQWCQAVALSA